MEYISYFDLSILNHEQSTLSYSEDIIVKYNKLSYLWYFLAV